MLVSIVNELLKWSKIWSKFSRMNRQLLPKSATITIITYVASILKFLPTN